MKRIAVLILCFIILPTFATCGKMINENISQSKPSSTPQSETVPNPTAAPDSHPSDESVQNNSDENGTTNISIIIGNNVFSAKLYDNDAAKALLEQLPMTLNMSELNGNEKYYYLSDSLPTASERVENIKNGDLMLYGSDCLVLFYKSFSTAYSYTRLGYIEDVSGFSAALGNGSVEVTFTAGK